MTTAKMVTEDGIKAGETYLATYKGEEIEARTVEMGGMVVVMVGNEQYHSLIAAAKGVRGYSTTSVGFWKPVGKGGKKIALEGNIAPVGEPTPAQPEPPRVPAPPKPFDAEDEVEDEAPANEPTPILPHQRARANQRATVEAAERAADEAEGDAPKARKRPVAVARVPLAVGTQLTATFKGNTYGLEVVEDGDGKIHYRLDGGRAYTSPSAAGKAITGWVSCDGWKFWTVTPA